MTYKYHYIRREMYEVNPASKLNANRSLSDMVRLFKRPYWFMLGGMLLSIVAFIGTVICAPNSPFMIISVLTIVLLSILSQIPREKHLYNNSVRTGELSRQMEYYEQYIKDIWMILHKYDINAPEKVKALKTECETVLKAREDKYSKISGKVVDMLIGVPLGALIASIMYADNNTIPTAIVALIVLGFMSLGCVKIIRSINFYSEGYFKDKCLLDALEELDYSENKH